MHSISQAALRLGVCTRTIRRWDARGIIHCRRTPGNHRRITPAEVDRLLGVLHRSVREHAVTKHCAIYARVSGHRQKTDGDLDRHLKTLYLENLKNYQPPRGYGTHSWRLSNNLWSKVLDTIRYMRQTLGHRYGGIWTVSPAWTSQTCHVCGGRGVRVEHESSTRERRGGEYFYCGRCDEHFHADVNAARNIIHVQDHQSSAAPGRTA